MNRTLARVPDLAHFSTALHLHPTIEAVVEHNVARLRASGQPIATIKAIHTGPNAAKASYWRCRWIGANRLPSARSSYNAHCQPLGGQGTGQWLHGNSCVHLLCQWWSSTAPHCCCHGAVWFISGSYTPWWHCSYHPPPAHVYCWFCFLHASLRSPYFNIKFHSCSNLA